MRTRSLDEGVDARTDGALGGTLGSRNDTGAVDGVVTEDEKVKVGSTGDGRPGGVGAAGDVRRSRAYERSPASLHLLRESELTASKTDVGGVEDGEDVVLVGSIAGERCG